MRSSSRTGCWNSSRRAPPITHVVLVASAIGDIDASGVQQLTDIDKDLASSGIELHMVTVRGPVRDVLLKAGLWDAFVAAGRVHTTIQAAVEALVDDAGSPLLAPAADHETPPPGFA
ncbi:MAG: sodium-independent anion transporter [Geodermatophilaceae bacterium]